METCKLTWWGGGVAWSYLGTWERLVLGANCVNKLLNEVLNFSLKLRCDLDTQTSLVTDVHKLTDTIILEILIGILIFIGGAFYEN